VILETYRNPKSGLEKIKFWLWTLLQIPKTPKIKGINLY